MCPHQHCNNKKASKGKRMALILMIIMMRLKQWEKTSMHNFRELAVKLP
jgi:hypothetical protein